MDVKTLQEKIYNMAFKYSYQEMVMLRDYSSAFSRNAIHDVIKYHDYSHLNWIYQQYNIKSKGIESSYLELLKKLYASIAKDYRCEYVYKNELIKYLISQYGTKETTAYNEFHVGNSIVDIALFNGESKAFEIKTEYDTTRRLGKQLDDYRKVFDKCYVVVPYEKVDTYISSLDKSFGIISLERKNGRIYLTPIQDATLNNNLDPELILSCLHIDEYVSIVSEWIGTIPNVPKHQLYKECLSIFKQIPENALRKFFVTKIKGRKSNTLTIKKTPFMLRQICLSMNLSSKDIETLVNRLSKQIV